MNETFRNPRSAGSSSIDSSPAFCAGEIADGSGCHSRLQQIVCQPLETGLEGGWCRGTPPETESRSQAQIEPPATAAAAAPRLGTARANAGAIRLGPAGPHHGLGGAHPRSLGTAFWFVL